ncbi:sulfate adenylyltransferase subunit CysN [Legionella spiritensis]|uniref:sulfate adenylyltransferase subunit CysN n=1 Tax=Legionella spiritensis TaxID=452 RepID=UPI000F6CF73D|nr:sulfate adenylyltransferase subunit CysN [Legionella spiritensis]VEG89669.1 elongation factor Tu (EF-Tu) [Legionella spiritensis]
MHATQAKGKEFTTYLNEHYAKKLLRFITCGSVDDGKSTLIGRLLYESKMLYEDQLTSLEQDSKKYGNAGEFLDFALLVDGLAAEREQGITIDVAYRFFSTDTRKFIVADTPGHEQYTRNMATGASTASLAVVIVDARKGILTQTRRHSFIVSMLGVKQIILAVNKMDLVNYDESVFSKIRDDYISATASLGLHTIKAIPLSALKGDNVVSASFNMPWYREETLLSYLDGVEIETPREHKPFRMPVQWVNRPHQDFRGFSGFISSGEVSPGQRIKILPSGKETTVKSIVTYDGELAKAEAGQSITCTLTDEVDVSRGDVLVDAASPCEIADQFNVTLLWMSEKAMVAGREYVMKIGSATVLATPSKPKYRIDVNTMDHLATRDLALNEIGCCEVSLDKSIVFDAYKNDPCLGGFILIDRRTNDTVAAGLINFALRRSQNIHIQTLLVDQGKRSLIKTHNPFVLWLTGLPSSGKSTIGNLLESRLNALSMHTMMLDGDNIRHGLNRDLGFTESDRAENIRRIAEVAKLMVEAGLITIVSFISPYKEERETARKLIGDGRFIEVFVDTPLEVAEERDTKGLYKKARSGKIINFTGIDSVYESPEKPELHLETVKQSPDECVDNILSYLYDLHLID